MGRDLGDMLRPDAATAADNPGPDLEQGFHEIKIGLRDDGTEARAEEEGDGDGEASDQRFDQQGEMRMSFFPITHSAPFS